MGVPDVSIRVVDLVTIIGPHVFMAPAGAHLIEVVLISTIVIAGHLQAVFADGPRHDDVVDLPSGIMAEHVVCASSCGRAFEYACHADWIMIVNYCE